jgi:predicted DNA binding protein
MQGLTPTKTPCRTSKRRLSGSVPCQPRVDGQPGLTDIQHETLVTALQEGYYNTPRAITMDELAAQFGISQPALSKRLRSGHSTLIENSLMVQPPDTEADQ